jgi:hypothetical protein
MPSPCPIAKVEFVATRSRNPVIADVLLLLLLLEQIKHPMYEM